jgi:PKD repeat protein
MKKLLFFTFVIVVAMGAGRSFAYTVPENDSNVQFFYVTGPKGDPLTGADDHKQIMYIDVPEDAEGDVNISVFDPDTGGALYDHNNPEKGGDLDGRESGENPWDTDTEITLTGTKGVKYSKRFGDAEYNRDFYNFKSLSKEDGVKTGAYYRFTLSITAVSGDDENLFKVKVSPESARVSSPNITFRLLAEEGAKMYFYPLVPEGVSRILVENYDLDHSGGTSILRDPKENKDYDISDSASGEWHQTEVSLSSTKERFLEYIITKGTQIEAHAGLRISDMNGNPIPIHFRKKARPVFLGTCNEFTFDATSSFDPDNQALTYHWDFGDGTVSDEPVVTHRFEQGGDFNVILSVQDNSGLECDTAVASQVVSVNTPPVASLTGPGKACTNQVVTFDASGTTDSTPGQITYNWDFGDGTSAEGVQVTKSFDKGGSYNVQLAVDDGSGTTCSTDSAGKVITVNTKPVAHAGDDVDLCLQHNQDYNVSFNGSRSVDEDGDSLTYRWDFGDGSEDSGANVTHLYQKRGEYVATLFVDDGSGTACSSSSDKINVKLNKAPVAVAGNDVIVCQGTEVLFDGSGSIGEEGENLKYEWDFGDGATGVGAKLAHTYQTGGTYKAVLTVDDLENTPCSTSIEKVFVTVNSKPSAIFSGANIACTGEEVSFDASETSDPDGDDLTYTWDFGDGTDAHGGTSITHTYNAGGVYSVRLTVDDGKETACSKNLAAMNVSINTPPSVVLNGANVACTGDAVSFDATGSSDADGDSLTYTWDFGDGSDLQTGASVTHAYSTGGAYLVRVTANDNKGTACSKDTAAMNVSINTSPSAVLNGTKLACTGDEISFDTAGSNDPDGDDLSYVWDFGDGTDLQTGSNVTHAYSKGGVYAVKLITNDDKGTECSRDMAAINVRINTPPVADAGPNHVCCLDAVSDFDGSGSSDADGDTLSYSWNFGDGNTGEGAKVTHVYSKPGTYIVSLTVNDNSGTECDSATDTFTATVNAKPTSIIQVR